MFSIVFSPVNQAWFILFGTGPVATRSVLRIVASREEAEELLASWEGR